MHNKIFTPRKCEVYLMYPDEPKYSLMNRMNAIIKSCDGNPRKHGLTPKEWNLLKEEIGEPTHDRYGEPILDETG